MNSKLPRNHFTHGSVDVNVTVDFDGQKINVPELRGACMNVVYSKVIPRLTEMLAGSKEARRDSVTHRLAYNTDGIIVRLTAKALLHVSFDRPLVMDVLRSELDIEFVWGLNSQLSAAIKPRPPLHVA